MPQNIEFVLEIDRIWVRVDSGEEAHKDKEVYDLFCLIVHILLACLLRIEEDKDVFLEDRNKVRAVGQRISELLDLGNPVNKMQIFHQ